jgi:hypothetical protein
MNQSTSTNSAPGVPTVGAEVDVDADPPAPIVEVVPPLPPLVLYGLEVPGDGMAVVGCGKGVIGTARRIRALFWVPHRYAYQNGRHVFIRGGWK